MQRQINSAAEYWVRLRKEAPSGNNSGANAANATIFLQASPDIGYTDDAAATSDTGDFSLISLFKRLLQKITSGIPTTGVVYANSSRTAIDATTATTSRALYAASAAPKIIYNGATTPVYVRYGTTAATIAAPTYELAAGASVEDSFAGAAQVIAGAGATGSIVVTELAI